MSWNVAKIGFIDVVHVATSKIDEARLSKARADTGDEHPFVIYLESTGPDCDGVCVEIHMANRCNDDDPLAQFYIPDSSWKTFVEAVNCVDKMWDRHYFSLYKESK